MNDTTNSKLFDQLVTLKQKQFTGKIQVQADNDLSWKLYLCLGRLVWTSGGIHPHRSWKRLLNRFSPQVNWQKLQLERSPQFECEHHYALMCLIRQNLLPREQATELVRTKAIEVLFDLFQLEDKLPLKLSFEAASASSFLASELKVLITLVNIGEVLREAQQAWLIWQKKGLKMWSPHLAPIMKEQQGMREEVSRVVFQNFLRLLDGQRTLLDLAYLMRKDVCKLTSSLSHYVNQGLLELIEIEDIQPIKFIKTSSKNTSSQKPVDEARPLVVCIDDSPQICKVMKHIILKAGYRFVGVQEAIQAIPTLISTNPDFVFLDIGMPIVNGYEICSQIRRVSKFKKTPVVILTGNDGIVDRVRAKVVGATDFVAKPIEVEKIVKTIEKYLPDTERQDHNKSLSENEEVQSKVNIA